MTTNGTNMNPASAPEPRVPLASRLSFPRLWFTAVGVWLIFGLFLLLRSSNSEITYLVFVASALPVAAVVRRRWFKPWVFVAEKRLLTWEKRISIISVLLLVTAVLPTLAFAILISAGIENPLSLGQAIAGDALIHLIWLLSVGLLCSTLGLQFITDVWNIRWTSAAVLAHLPILVIIAIWG